jgi:CxxC motif-containing protein (DUF1111 family)
MRNLSTWLATALVAVPLAGSVGGAEPEAAADRQRVNAETVSGREIFVREWVPNDPRSHGGDGLGPVFNGSSCVTCHNQGGAGGAGGFDENVTLLSAAFAENPAPQATGAEFDAARKHLETQRKATLEQLAQQVHPDFAQGDTVVVHKFGNADEHRTWRQRVGSGQFVGLQPVQRPGTEPTPFSPQFPGSVAVAPPQQAFVVTDGAFVGVQQLQSVNISGTGGFGNAESFPILGRIQNDLNAAKAEARSGLATSFGFNSAAMQTSQRNTTALWGSGRIDRIPEAAIVDLAERQREAGGKVSGRVHHLPDGKVGRFGWKAQKASLYDFTMAACAVELGLNVPGEKQANVPYDREYAPAGLDLEQHEVDALVEYIASLPVPGKLEPGNADVADRHLKGADLFASVGCAECHAPQVGEVTGLYTDLLLHDLGPDLGSVGSYGVPSLPESDPDDIPIARGDKPQAVPPTSREWRTPALWGVRDSAPYLHDGRARTIEQAIAFHGGEAAESRLRFMLLETREREQVLAFLKTLVAPDSVAAAK